MNFPMEHAVIILRSSALLLISCKENKVRATFVTPSVQWYMLNCKASAWKLCIFIQQLLWLISTHQGLLTGRSIVTRVSGVLNESFWSLMGLYRGGEHYFREHFL